VDCRASDIYFEPVKACLQIKYRIDGMLYPVLQLAKEHEPPLLPVLCVMAGWALYAGWCMVYRGEWGRLLPAVAAAGLTALAAFTPTGYERQYGTQLWRDHTTRAQMALAENEDALARAMLERAVRVRPDYDLAWLKLGIAQLKLGDTVASAAAFAATTRANPLLFEGWMNLGYVQDLLHDTGAVASYRRALALRPDDAQARAGAGLTARQ